MTNLGLLLDLLVVILDDGIELSREDLPSTGIAVIAASTCHNVKLLGII